MFPSCLHMFLFVNIFETLGTPWGVRQGEVTEDLDGLLCSVFLDTMPNHIFLSSIRFLLVGLPPGWRCISPLPPIEPNSIIVFSKLLQHARLFVSMLRGSFVLSANPELKIMHLFFVLGDIVFFMILILLTCIGESGTICLKRKNNIWLKSLAVFHGSRTRQNLRGWQAKPE